MKLVNIRIFKQTCLITCLVLLSNIFLETESEWSLNNIVLASSKNNFKITSNTLDHLQREGFTKALTEMFVPMINKVYSNRTDFLNSLPILLV